MSGLRFRSARRSPYGERGLKSGRCLRMDGRQESLSLRRAWIEISSPTRSPTTRTSLSLRRAWIEINSQRGVRNPRTGRSPYGERGLKLVSERVRIVEVVCRSPYGERGLKYASQRGGVRQGQSLSLRRAWIEINGATRSHIGVASRSPYGERGLKSSTVAQTMQPSVALLTESVD